MKKLKKILALFVASLLIFVAASCDGKKPEAGYLSEAEIDEVISNFTGDTVPTAYSVSGNLNYFNITDDVLPGDVLIEDLPFTPYNEQAEGQKNKYLQNCASLFLRMPLQITNENWHYEDDAWQTRYQIEAKLFRTVDSMDKAYYYRTSEGGLIIKCFGVNKELKINNKELYSNDLGGDYIIDIECSGKWNITIEYNSDGLLVKEDFETLNRSNKKEECCYGIATYEYF